MQEKKVINHLLSELDIHPILFDIGASCAPPEIWKPIAKQSIYVGFDPNLSDSRKVAVRNFHKAIIIDKAVTSDKGSEEVLFYYTKSPYCSSTLKPDSKSLSDFVFSDSFVVEREGNVQATTLDSAIERLSLSGIDWLKTDSQGTDLRIFNSLREEFRRRVLVIDIEPGLIDAYIGEDLFVDTHRDLTQNGFWFSKLDVHGAVRIKEETLQEVRAFNKDITCDLIKRNIKESPGWVNARYFRTIEWLTQGNFDKRGYVLLWIFSFLDAQLGFALDLAMEYERKFGRDDLSQIMRDHTILHIRRSRHNMFFVIAKSILPIRLRQWLKETYLLK